MEILWPTKVANFAFVVHKLRWQKAENRGTWQCQRLLPDFKRQINVLHPCKTTYTFNKTVSLEHLPFTRNPPAPCSRDR